ncbi:MAG: hypothetical protein PHE10_11110, partial [Kiritimatiellae bacterium]|nr:hypothetical protein [Kiritimatiellia bacterium]
MKNCCQGLVRAAGMERTEMSVMPAGASSAKAGAISQTSSPDGMTALVTAKPGGGGRAGSRPASMAARLLKPSPLASAEASSVALVPPKRQ